MLTMIRKLVTLRSMVRYLAIFTAGCLFMYIQKLDNAPKPVYYQKSVVDKKDNAPAEDFAGPAGQIPDSIYSNKQVHFRDSPDIANGTAEDTRQIEQDQLAPGILDREYVSKKLVIRSDGNKFNNQSDDRSIETTIADKAQSNHQVANIKLMSPPDNQKNHVDTKRITTNNMGQVQVNMKTSEVVMMTSTRNSSLQISNTPQYNTEQMHKEQLGNLSAHPGNHEEETINNLPKTGKAPTPQNREVVVSDQENGKGVSKTEILEYNKSNAVIKTQPNTPRKHNDSIARNDRRPAIAARNASVNIKQTALPKHPTQPVVPASSTKASQETLKEKVHRILAEIPFSDQNLLPRCYKPVTNFVYIKNHKCGSDSAAAVFRRFGYSRNLTFVQPVHLYWNIGWPHRLQPFMYRALKSEQFNILTEHTTYDAERLGKLMPADSRYITSLREPYSRLKSVFSYFNYPKLVGQKELLMEKGAHAVVDYFLQQSNKTEIDKLYMRLNTSRAKVCVPPGLSMIRNAMSFELGLPVGFHSADDRQEDLDYIKKWLQHVDEKFTMVVLLGYFSESLVMLKRLMCWTAKDVFFTRLNTRSDGAHRDWNHFGDPKIESFLSWSFADTLLYTHFNNTLWRRVRIMGAADFKAEVEDFKTMHEKTMAFCKGLLDSDPPTDRSLVFRQSRWNPDIVIGTEDCRMMFSKGALRKEIRERYDNNPKVVDQPQPPEGYGLLGC